MSLFNQIKQVAKRIVNICLTGCLNMMYIYIFILQNILLKVM